MPRVKFSFPAMMIMIMLVPACGGGGGGSSESGTAARVELSLDRHRIDTGERVTVVTEIRDVNALGVMVKFRFPKGLSYVLHSSYLTVDDWRMDVGPSHYDVNGDYGYLVFFFSQAQFGESLKGELEFVLDGIGESEDDVVAVDADIDDPAVPDEDQFDPANPDFSEEDADAIRVDDGDPDSGDDDDDSGDDDDDSASTTTTTTKTTTTTLKK